MVDRCDILIIGAGIAGVSLASRLAGWNRRVWVLEQEEYSPFHTTDRALAPWDPAWVSDDDTAALAWAGAGLWDEIPHALTRKPMLHIFAEDWLAAYPDMFARGVAAGTGVQQLEGWEIAKRFPYLKTEGTHCAAGLYAPAGAAGTINVRRIYSHFRSLLYRRSGRIFLKEALEEASYGGGAWTVRTNMRTIRTEVIVNCAGAWADEVARRCDTRRLYLQSTKRTLLSLETEADPDVPWGGGPFIVWKGKDADCLCDIRPEGRVAISPADEEPSSPCDAEVEAWQVAAAIARFEEWTKMRLIETSGFSSAWLRTVAKDRRPVMGWAREVPAFFWSTAFGGTGIECALAASAIAADMIQNQSESSELVSRYGIRTERFSPDRLGYAGVTC